MRHTHWPDDLPDPPFEAQVTYGKAPDMRASWPPWALRLWPDPDYAQWSPRRGWWRPEPRSLPAINVETAAPAEELWRQVPLHSSWSVIDERMDAVHWRLVWYLALLAHHVPEAASVALPCSAVVPALASWLTRSRSLRRDAARIRSALGGRCRDLLPLMGLPPTRRMERILSRLGLGAMDRLGRRQTPVVELLRRADDLHPKWLQHLQYLSPEQVAVLAAADVGPLLSFGLVEGVHPFNQPEVLAQLRETARARAAAEAPRQPLVFRSTHQLDDFACTHLRRWRPRRADAAIAGPLFAPTDQVVLGGSRSLQLTPLRDAQQVAKHGERQQNCLSEPSYYLRAVHRGSGALYRVRFGDPEAPSEGTLFLKRRGARWSVSELEQADHAAPPDWVWNQLGRWVRHLGEPVDERQLGLPGIRW